MQNTTESTKDKQDEIVMIPLIAKENSDNKFLKIIKFLFVVLLISNLLWFGSWLVYWFSPTTSTDVTLNAEDDGDANYINGEGDINNGENNSSSDNRQD